MKSKKVESVEAEIQCDCQGQAGGGDMLVKGHKVSSRINKLWSSIVQHGNHS